MYHTCTLRTRLRTAGAILGGIRPSVQMNTFIPKLSVTNFVDPTLDKLSSLRWRCIRLFPNRYDDVLRLTGGGLPLVSTYPLKGTYTSCKCTNVLTFFFGAEREACNQTKNATKSSTFLATAAPRRAFVRRRGVNAHSGFQSNCIF